MFYKRGLLAQNTRFNPVFSRARRGTFPYRLLPPAQNDVLKKCRRESSCGSGACACSASARPSASRRPRERRRTPRARWRARWRGWRGRGGGGSWRGSGEREKEEKEETSEKKEKKEKKERKHGQRNVTEIQNCAQTSDKRTTPDSLPKNTTTPKSLPSTRKPLGDALHLILRMFHLNESRHQLLQHIMASPRPRRSA